MRVCCRGLFYCVHNCVNRAQTSFDDRTLPDIKANLWRVLNVCWSKKNSLLGKIWEIANPEIFFMKNSSLGFFTVLIFDISLFSIFFVLIFDMIFFRFFQLILNIKSLSMVHFLRTVWSSWFIRKTIEVRTYIELKYYIRRPVTTVFLGKLYYWC